MDEITYILGAGASYYSMPLVTSFVERFNYFQNAFLSFQSGSDNGKKLIDHCHDFIADVENHLSFDTFFKKLFHQDKPELTILYKKILLLYFIYEHLVDVSSKDGIHPLKSMGKAKNLDPRYDALIAGLMEPIKEENKFFVKLNFITWNYDLNLFAAIRNFLFPGMDLGALFRSRSEYGHHFNFSNQCSIVHLNGIMYHPSLKEIKVLNPRQMEEHFKTLIAEFYETDSPMNQYSSIIKFAWESLESRKGQAELPFIARAKEFIQNSKKIVIIGYSFPLYNRLVDMSFLNANTLNGKGVYIQDPDANNLKSILSEAFSLKFEKARNEFCEPITDCKSFFVPKDVFIKP